MTLALLLSACTFRPGVPFAEIVDARLEARFEPGERALGDGAVTTDQGYRYVITAFSVQLETIALEAAEEEAGEEPANCHGDHCHGENGELIEAGEEEHDEEHDEEHEEHDDAHGEVVTDWERSDTLDLLLGAEVDLGQPTEPDLPKGTLEHLVLVAESARVLGRFESQDGQSSLPFTLDLPGSSLMAELDLEIGARSPETLALTIDWTVDGTLFDGINVQSLPGAPDPNAVLVEAVAEHLWHGPLDAVLIEAE